MKSTKHLPGEYFHLLELVSVEGAGKEELILFMAAAVSDFYLPEDQMVRPR